MHDHMRELRNQPYRILHSIPAAYPRAIMASSSFMNVDNSRSRIVSVPAADRAPLVPIGEMSKCRSVDDLQKIIGKYNLGDDAKADTRVASVFHSTVRVVVTKVVKMANGDVPTARWHKQDVEEQATMVRRLTEEFPWMKRFEGGWVAKLFLSRCINNKINESQRKTKQFNTDTRSPRESGGRFRLLLG